MSKNLFPLFIFIVLLTLTSLACSAISGGVEPTQTRPPALATSTTRPTQVVSATEETSGIPVHPTEESSGKPAPLPTIPPPEVVGGDVHQWATSAIASSEYGTWEWSAMQAAGGPNTLDCGDMRSAWASQSPDTIDTIELTYSTPVNPKQINIHQSFNPGQISKVEYLDVMGEYHEVFAATPVQLERCPDILTIDLDPSQFTTQLIAVRITVDQTVLGLGWAEIDAVEVVGQSDAAAGSSGPTGELVHTWANAAEADSEYGASDWSAMQAAGEPNTQVCGDNTTAWASADSNQKADLTLWYYDIQVVPVTVNIYQSYNPSQVVRVTVMDPSSEHPETVIYEADPIAIGECPYILSIPVENVDFPVMQVRITIDQSALGLGWNEIDAVELVGYVK